MIITPQLQSNITYGLGDPSPTLTQDVTRTILFDDFVSSYTIHTAIFTDTLSFVSSVVSKYPITSTLIFTSITGISVIRSRSIRQRIVFGQHNHRAGERKKTKPWLRLTYPDVVNKL